MAETKRSSRIVVPQATRWHQKLGAWLLVIFMKSLAATLRYKWTDRSGYFAAQPPGPTIYCIWHNRLALCMKIYFGYVYRHNNSAGLAALISASRDGGFLSDVLSRFGVSPVRGSSSRRGAQALLELSSKIKAGYDVAITPDGPRGPCYKVQPGVIALAQVTGLKVVPVACRLGWKIRLKSWDRFQIPLPFSTCEIIFEKPLEIQRETSDEERESLRLQLEQTLIRISGD